MIYLRQYVLRGMHGRQQMLGKQHQYRADRTDSKHCGPDLNPADCIKYLAVYSINEQATRNNHSNSTRI